MVHLSKRLTLRYVTKCALRGENKTRKRSFRVAWLDLNYFLGGNLATEHFFINKCTTGSAETFFSLHSSLRGLQLQLVNWLNCLTDAGLLCSTGNKRHLTATYLRPDQA